MVAMDQYYSDLSAIENIIRNWNPIKKTVEGPSVPKTRIPRSAKSKDAGALDTAREEIVSKFHIWYVKASNPWLDTMHDAIVAGMRDNFLAKSTLDVYQLVSITPIPEVLSISESMQVSDLSVQENRTENRRNSKRRKRRASSKQERKMTSKTEDQSLVTTKSKDTINATVSDTILEEYLKPRWILQPNESQKFKIRFQPEETGLYDETYALTIVDGNNLTYEVKINGIADIPRVDMNPNNIYTKTAAIKLDNADGPTYYLNSGIYDFGSMLVLQKDKRPHRREAELKFRNVSNVDAEMCFSLEENNASCFSIQPEKLLIDHGNHGILILSAITTKLGPISEKLYVCLKNNPKVEVIKLESEGAKVDIELDEKQLSFGRTLLYRREFRVLTAQNKTPVAISWQIETEESFEPQITYAPDRGVIKPWNEQKIEFCYHGGKVGVIETQTVTFKAFLCEENEEPIFADTVRLSGETYDVAVDIDHANPIDLKWIRVNSPARGLMTIRNRGDYQVEYVITLEDNEKLTKLGLPANLKKNLEVSPVSGSIPPYREKIVEVTFIPKDELSLKEVPILKCHLIDTNKETTIVAEIPLAVSLNAYYTRFQVHPYPLMDFGPMAVCTETTMYLNVENTGKFPLHYSIRVASKHPSVIYMSQTTKADSRKKQNLTARTNTSKMGKRSIRSKKAEIEDHSEPEKLIVGPMTIAKTEGDVDAGQTDSIAVTCYPEIVGTQDEQIVVFAKDSEPEDGEGKTVTLFVNSLMPNIDFEDLDSIFRENHVVDRIQDFDCPKEIGPHTVFARQEKSLYFRYVSVMTTHAMCFKLYNRNIIPASVDVYFVPESLMPSTAKPDTFVVKPRNERVPPMSYKTFTVSFTPTIIETFKCTLEATVILPPHLDEEKLSIKLVGESCVPEVAIIEPIHGNRERTTLNFGRTLINEFSYRKFVLENIGFIKAKVIVEIDEDQYRVFTFEACPDTRHLLQIWDSGCEESNDRYTVVRLTPGNVACFKVTFSPNEIGKRTGKIRLFVVDNPYENMTINLEGESYMEPLVLEGLEFEDNKRSATIGNRNSVSRTRRLSTKQNSLASAPASSSSTASLTYILNYGLCVVSKMYKKTIRIANKSPDRWFRFQWSEHPNVVFVPTIGHIKFLTCKEVIATFLASEPTNHVNTRIECIVWEIVATDDNEAWDDRQTEVRWKSLQPDLVEKPKEVEVLSKRIVRPAPEPERESVAGTTKTILVLLNATVAFSEYFCPVREIYFKDTLMFQTREYTFTLSNPGTMNTQYVWKVTMDEQYPKRRMENSPIGTSRPRTADGSRTRPNSRSQRGIFSATSDPRRVNFDADGKSAGDSGNLLSLRFASSVSDTVEMKGSSAKRTDLFSSSAGLSERTTDSWLEGDDLPFAMHPDTGTISPQESVECTLKFSPIDVFYYKSYLTCRIENLDPKLPELTIPVAARSLLPYCHFDVQESDYITSGRRDPTRPGPLGRGIEDPALWQNIRVIEFKVVGVGETHAKKFHLINPTMDDYRFTWKDRTPHLADEISNFHCTVPEGIAERGKQTDLAFTFLAKDVGVFESFWLFSIERYNLESLFLVVATVTEPSVHRLTVHVKLKPTILGHNVRDSIRLLNDEDFSIPFKVLEESLYSEGKFQKLAVTPLSGSLAPKSEQLLWVEYHPTRVGEFDFSIHCAVKLMKSPLAIFVTASVYEILSSVSYSVATDEIVRACEDTDNVIDLGKLMPNSPIAIKFDITNSGKTAFYYIWDIGMTPEVISRNAYAVTTPQKQGYMISESRSTCNLTLTTFRKTTIKDHRITLKILNGPTYRFLLKASSKKPGIEFNFDRYDFGPCYIQENNALSYYTELCLSNSEDASFIIECKFEEQPHLSVDLNSISVALAARSTITIPITFRPLKETKYNECLIFTIDSRNEKKITITGEGITYKIRLVNPCDKLIDLGSVSASRTVIRKIPVINEGLAPIEIKFDLMNNLSGYEEYRERARSCAIKEINENEIILKEASVMETKRSWTRDVILQTDEPRLADVLRIEPSSSVVLKPKKKINVTVKFRPTSRMRPFTGKIGLQTSSTVLPLFMVNGSCVGADFRLNRTYVSFGSIVEGCTEEAKIVLMNVGDVGARFKWNTSKLPADFRITPVSGYCSPTMDVNFIIKFQPSQRRSLIQGEAIIDIEKFGSLEVRITGGCCKLPEPADTIFFESVVRAQQTQTVSVLNDTNVPWKLKPEVTGDYYFVDEILHVPAKELAFCTVTYAPTAMNTENTPHTGTLLLKLPDEKSPLLYSLRGNSLPPEALAKIYRRFPAKTKYTELLPVHNWLNRQQRFQCKILPMISDNANTKEIPLYNFIGNNKIDVPSNSQRDYRAVFYSYAESSFHFKVTFTNEDKEYQFYEIEYDVTEPEVLESIKLTTSVRSQVCHNLKLKNPLEYDSIIYVAKCDDPFISIRDMPKTVPPLSSEYVNVNYYPMLPTENSIVMLDINCPELGHFPYELRLKALPALPEKVTRVNATLGSSYVFPLSVRNCTEHKTKFTIQIDNDCFTSPSSIEVSEISNGIVEVVYEPCNIENVTATLTASSETAGEFIFPLIGTCSLPKIMGPYTITQKESTSIRFRNVFKETKPFNFLTDVPEIFAIETLSASLDPKQTIDIKVSLLDDKQDDEDFTEEKNAVTGKLLIYCTDHNLSHINWVYYLRGIFE
ncbi:hydrocephalus-inducing protein-like [Colletes gigas]|uniref:hydrocephalus-inducing protein-like n=1 Tax=Colletes gigas TaxID=935657 RepID=UPI001C9A8A12|nr:hydrocephalus-inducing protein-like [Colletes gigas]